MVPAPGHLLVVDLPRVTIGTLVSEAGWTPTNPYPLHVDPAGTLYLAPPRGGSQPGRNRPALGDPAERQVHRRQPRCSR